jgi:ubiquinone/menaquinone biosynthesis C-methylase UbiE
MTSPPHEFDQYKENYASYISAAIAFSGQSHDFYLKLKADHLHGIIAKTFGVGTPVKLLDVGCGHGLMHPLLAAPNIELSACDPAASVIEEAKLRNPSVAYLANDGRTLPYEDNVFDVAVAACVLHHVEPAQWGDFLREMKRVVRPGGLLVIYENNPYNPFTLHIVKNCPIDENAVLLKCGVLKKLLSEVGLKAVDRDYIIFFPNSHDIFRKIESRLTWLPLGAQYAIYGSVA